MTKRKKVIIWSSSLGSGVLGLIFWVFRSAILHFLEDAVAWKFPLNFACIAIVAASYPGFKYLKRKLATRSFSIPRIPMSVKIIAAIALIMLAGLSLLIGYIIVGDDQPAKVEQKTENARSATQKQTEEIPTSRKVLGVIIILIVVGIFVSGARSQWEPGEKWYKQNFLRGPVGIAVYVMLFTYLTIAFLLPKLWDLIWDDQIFFWSLTIGVVVLTGLRTMKGSDNKPLTYAKKGSLVFGAIWLLGLSVQMSRNPYWQGLELSWSRDNHAPQTRPGESFGDIPADVALPIICGCESSGGIPPGRQFEDDRITPYKNRPKPGEKQSSAIGMCQILASAHEKRALDKFNLDIKTEKGNWEYAKILYNESTPHTKHWEGTPGNTTKACWGPKLAKLGYGGGQVKLPLQLAVVDVPTDKWSEEISIPPINNAVMVWGRLDGDKGGKCEVMFDKDSNKVFPTTETHNEIAPNVIQFKCAEPSAQIKISIVPST